ncbi:TPA: hypothetical protein DDZ86_05315 [Candidatus Dependentiae bacterium]|nr:hypothetical protein [Candidatus Dependentiae bacterium]
MYPILFHLYGSLSIQTYGACIALGVITVLILASWDKRVSAVISADLFVSMVNLTILMGIVGGRLLYILMEPQQFNSPIDLIAIWDGGFSVLGSIFTVIPALILYLRRHHLPLLPLLDIVGLYAPLVQAFGRVGCFFAGCCHGSPTTLFWSVTYTDPHTVAPLCIALHPTQLYNAIALLILFLALHFYMKASVRSGEILSLSLLGLVGIRFVTDFWRGDRQELIQTFLGPLSTHQLISLGIMVATLILFIALRYIPQGPRKAARNL